VAVFPVGNEPLVKVAINNIKDLFARKSDEPIAQPGNALRRA
jgi:hypothetical protein